MKKTSVSKINYISSYKRQYNYISFPFSKISKNWIKPSAYNCIIGNAYICIYIIYMQFESYYRKQTYYTTAIQMRAGTNEDILE